MGAALSASDCPLAVAAVAEITQFDSDQLRALCAACHGKGALSELQYETQDVPDEQELTDDVDNADELEDDLVDAHSDLKHPVDLSWTAFLHALDVAKLAPSDRAILERMFTLMDKTGDELVSRRELLVGACVLLQGDLLTKLQAAVEIHRMTVSDAHGPRRPSQLPSSSYKPSHDALLFILSAFAMVSSFFGDPMLKKTALSKAVHDALEAPESLETTTNTVLNALVNHPAVQQYIRQLDGDAEAHQAA